MTKRTTEAMVRLRLEQAFPQATIGITDESEMHRGHGGWREGGGTHFRLRIIAPDFSDIGLLARHRMVYDALAEELAGSVHALAIEALAPSDVDSSTSDN